MDSERRNEGVKMNKIKDLLLCAIVVMLPLAGGLFVDSLLR